MTFSGMYLDMKANVGLLRIDWVEYADADVGPE